MLGPEEESPRSIDAGSELPEEAAATPALPRMPAPPDGEQRIDRRHDLRRFHLIGRGEAAGAEPRPRSPLLPALLPALLEEEPAWRRYPQVLLDSQGGEDAPGLVSLADLLAGAAKKIEEDGASSFVLSRQLRTLVAVCARLLADRGGVASLRPTLLEACRTFAGELDLSAAGATALEAELTRLESMLPDSGTLLGPGARTFPILYLAALGRQRRQGREAYRSELRSLVTRLEELLRVDVERGPGGKTPDALSSTLGAAATGFLDPQQLSQNIPQERGPKRLQPKRRSRIATILGELSRYLDEASEAVDFVLVHSAPLDEGDLPDSVRSVRHDRPVEVAVELFDEMAEQMVTTIRADRIARLELEGAYEPELHEHLLASLRWQDFSDAELMTMPVVAAMGETEQLRTQSLAAFSELMRSGRPVQVLATEVFPGLGDDSERTTGYHSALGYLAVAHREVFVLQSTLARPEHLFAGLERMARSTHPAAAVVAVPPESPAIDPVPLLTAALYGRATPCYHYDAAAGASWAERFEMDGNPSLDRPWPELQLKYLDLQDAEQERKEAFTYAHAAALDGAWRDGLRSIPAEAWGEDQIEIGDYLDLPEDQRAAKLPFVWVLDEERRLARAVLTRELAFACRDRMRAWRIYQELAGVDNEYARRAAAEARRQALEEAEQQRRELDAAHAEELERVRARAAEEAAERIVGALMDLEPRAVSSVASPGLAMVDKASTVGRDEPALAAPPAEAAEQTVEEEEELGFDEPFIDSIMCTSCNDCTDINPRLFKYNSDKQAYIADAAAGTFEELVRATEKCPARCIHPGKPRADDATATAELITRAAPFNQ
jgi:ferredoxin